MQRGLRHCLPAVLLPLLFVLLAPPVTAQSIDKLSQVLANPAARTAAADAGRKVSTFCANCHGADGNSALGEVPNLAGQNATYLLNQINKFHSGERKDQWMEPAIRLLSETERLNLVVFYAGQQVRPAKSGPPSEAGKAVYRRVCARCHGDQALGGERYPRLAGQQHVYLVKALTAYRNRTGTRLEPEMLAMTAALKDADIQAVADYLSALH